ncbi:MAG: bifunctional adenosylcobinamide kinase/adenosylcobinamide-phosphate guanylyltransferase [Oscillospiraceae bacterium]|nr:bifunctional adenosylcobinamide kinase/adenosylcobinamide-phosphate guanylyltransferase [Oscillospiraceae bacterium]
MRIFISGGCKNGKSYYAQHLAKAQQTSSLYYIATMKSVDGEDDERIVRHRRERDGWGFETIEQPCDIENILSKCDCGGSFLLDSATALLAGEMFSDRGVNEGAALKIIDGLGQIMDKIKNIVIVSDYIYSDAFIYDELTEKYRKSLAEIDRAAAGGCEAVLEVAYTNVIFHKGREAYDKVF